MHDIGPKLKRAISGDLGISESGVGDIPVENAVSLRFPFLKGR